MDGWRDRGIDRSEAREREGVHKSDHVLHAARLLLPGLGTMPGGWGIIALGTKVHLVLKLTCLSVL